MPKVKIYTKEDLQKMKKRKFWNLFYLIAWLISVPLVFLLLPEAWNLLLRITASVALTILPYFCFSTGSKMTITGSWNLLQNCFNNTQKEPQKALF